MTTDIQNFKFESTGMAKLRAFQALVHMWWAEVNMVALGFGCALIVIFSTMAMSLIVSHPGLDDGGVIVACGAISMIVIGYFIAELVGLAFGRSLSWSDMFSYQAAGGLMEALAFIDRSDLMRATYQLKLDDIDLVIEKKFGGIIFAYFRIPSIACGDTEGATVCIRALAASNPAFRIERKPDWCKKELTEALLRQLANALIAWHRADVQRAKVVMDASNADAMVAKPV